jgi:hypothetical protein
MFDCPDCRASFDSLEGAAMHYLNKETGHTEFQSKRAVKDAIRGESESSTESTDGVSAGDRQTPPFGNPESGDPDPEPESESKSDPTVDLEPGQKVWVRNDARQIGRLEAESGDVLDPTRGVLVEADGTKWEVAAEPEGHNE